MDINLMNLLFTIIALVFGSVGVYLIKYLDIKIYHDTFDHYYQLAKTIVMSLEQINTYMSGEDKKTLATARFTELTDGRISELDADRLIESAVYEIKKLSDTHIN